MKKIIKIVSIAIILIITILTASVKANGVPEIYSGILKAFALSVADTEASMTIAGSYAEFNEDTENDDITINLDTVGLADGTEVEVSIQGYTLDNQELRRRFGIYSKR